MAMRSEGAAGSGARLSGTWATFLDVAGVSALITWSFVFWNGPALGGTLAAGAPISGAFLLQGVLTALTALALVPASGLLARPPRRTALFAALAACACASSALAGVAYALASRALALAAFGLSGVGSALFLCWQERLGARGAGPAAARTVAAYACSCLEFLGMSLLPFAVMSAIQTLLPAASLACALAAARAERTVPAAPTGYSLAAGQAGRLSERLGAVPWRLPVIVAIAYFCYGVTRVGGIVTLAPTLDLTHALGAVVPALCCLAGVALAYAAYRANALAGLYIAFPMLALGCLLDLGALPWGDVATFAMVNVGSELIRHLVWLLMIDVIVKDGASALLCLALLRVAHWGGCTLGQLVSGALGAGSVLSSVAVVLLMAGLFAIMGVETLFHRRLRPAAHAPAPAREQGAAGECGQAAPADGSGRAGAGAEAPATSAQPTAPGAAAAEARETPSELLQRRVERVARECDLTPRETEVLSIWVTGRTASYVEKALFISHSTVKTHLNHIYAKTATSNREELIELVNSRRPVRP